MTIVLELIDQATGDLLAESEVPVDSLPRSFVGMDTTLTVGDGQYHVVRADPETREAIAEAGRARLLLRRLEMVNPADILFSLPTLEDALPAGEAGEAASLQLVADAWRQCEFVAANQGPTIEAELAEVRAVVETKRVGAGYSALHVRRRVPTPLAGVRLTLAEVEAALESSARPLGVRGEVGRVAGGFAVPTAEALVYGVAEAGVVRVLGIFGLRDDVLGRLHALALAHDLVLVDWCNAARLRAHPAGFVT